MDNLDRPEIRPLQPFELQDLLEIYRFLHRQDEPLPADDIVHERWVEIMSASGHTILGLFIGSQLVSSCVLVIIPNLTRGCRPYGVIENVVTRAGFRGQGYGKQLLKAALQRAWGADCYKVMLMTGRKDDAVYRFYEGAGFKGDEKRAFIARPS